jgi:hypothetical protein
MWLIILMNWFGLLSPPLPKPPIYQPVEFVQPLPRWMPESPRPLLPRCDGDPVGVPMDDRFRSCE